MNEVNPAAVAGVQSQQMVAHLAQLTLEQLDERVLRAARIRLLDALGCGYYGAQMPWGKIAADVAYAEASQGAATILGHAAPIGPARAALCNGTAMHGIELDDIAEGTQTHPGAVVVSAALAAAEHCGASGARLLVAIVAGYEAMARVGRALGKSSWNFHMTGIAGPVGAAVAAGMLMGLKTEQIIRAVGIACSCSAGIKAFTQGSGGMVKRMHAGRAAESGVLACLLAQRGFTAPVAAIDGRFGLLDAFGDDHVNSDRLVEKLGQDYVVCHISTKLYACCGRIHTTAQALEALRAEHDFKPDEIDKIRVGAHASAVALNCSKEPKETMAAQYSLPFVAALAVASDPKNPRSFEGSALTDPVVCALAQRVDLYTDPEIDAMHPSYGTRVEVLLKDGRKYAATLRNPRGSPHDPCTEPEIKEKFRCLAAAALESAAIEAILDVVESLERLPSVAPLSAALRGSA